MREPAAFMIMVSCDRSRSSESRGHRVRGYGQFTKIMDTLAANRHGQQAAAAWIGKELLRDALNLRASITRSTPCERNVRDPPLPLPRCCAPHHPNPHTLPPPP